MASSTHARDNGAGGQEPREARSGCRDGNVSEGAECAQPRRERVEGRPPELLQQRRGAAYSWSSRVTSPSSVGIVPLSWLSFKPLQHTSEARRGVNERGLSE